MQRVAFHAPVTEWLSDIEKDEDAFLGTLGDGYSRAYGMRATQSEMSAWRRSLCGALGQALRAANVAQAHIFIELGMPMSSSRCDVLLIGEKSSAPNALVVELKQWDGMESGPYPGTVLVGGQLHEAPQAQVTNYVDYLSSTHPFFHECAVLPVCYLHEMQFLPRIADVPENVVVFCKGDNEALAEFLRAELPGQAGATTADAVLRVEYQQNPRLLEAASRAIRAAKDNEGRPTWVLLDGQSLASRAVAKALHDAKADDRKRLVIQEGGPGTGKSIVAMDLLARAAAQGIRVNHVSGLKAFRNTLGGSVIASGDSGLTMGQTSALFKLLHSYTKTEGEVLDLAICDEAHRARSRTTLRPHLMSNTPQAVELMRAAKVTFAILDERQILRSGEEGTVENWVRWAHDAGVLPGDVVILPPLISVFRADGDLGYTRWLDALLYEEPMDWPGGTFEVEVMESPAQLEQALAAQIHKGHSARMVAGFCWPWSKTYRDRPLALDVSIGSWERAWNAQVPEGDSEPSWQRHPYTLWATRLQDPLSQVGCIHSAQGFEFEYVGVIWGDDLVRRGTRWVAQPDRSWDNDVKGYRGRAQHPLVGVLLRNAYRVLMSRGLRGCYVYFTDPETAHFVSSMLRS